MAVNRSHLAQYRPRIHAPHYEYCVCDNVRRQLNTLCVVFVQEDKLVFNNARHHLNSASSAAMMHTQLYEHDERVQRTQTNTFIRIPAPAPGAVFNLYGRM